MSRQYRKPLELQVSNGQLLVEQEERSVAIPVNEMVMLVVCGAAIRLSTTPQTLLADNNVIILHLGKYHHPSAFFLTEKQCASIRYLTGNSGMQEQLVGAWVQVEL